MMGIPQPAFYIFKCQQSAPPGMPKPSCVSQNNPESQQLMQHLSQTLMQKGIIGNVQPIQSSCLGRCQQGPEALLLKNELNGSLCTNYTCDIPQ